MRSFTELNPISIFIYYTCAVILCMFCTNPLTALISLCGALAFGFMKYGIGNIKSHLFYLALFIVVSVANPLFSHNGKTVLFVMNDNPVTLEALYFGIVMGIMLTASVYWLKSFSKIMTSDKLLYIFGKISPKTALILSMTFRMIPLFKEQAKKTENAQKGMGLYKDDTLYSKFTGKVRIFSILVTWAAENAIITADSMEARGYSGQRRTNYSIFKFNSFDTVFTAVSILLCVPFFISLFLDGMEFSFYPVVTAPEKTFLYIFSVICYGIFCILPFIIEAGDKIKWKYFQSKI